MQLMELSLQSSQLKKNIQDLGFSKATQIQEKLIPLALEGKDISGISQTGTGKTYAFLIPTVEHILLNPKKQLALCLTPTRELALQVEEEAKKLIKGTAIRPISLIGGVPIQEQEKVLGKDTKLLIATPGRLMEHIKTGSIDPKKVNILIFDEADRMFDMGFIEDMRFILKKVDPKRQILLFSATMNFSVLNMIYSFKSEPIEVNISKDNIMVDKIKQSIYQVSDREKPKALLYLCNEEKKASIIVFVNYREKVNWLVNLLNENNIAAIGISSLLQQPKRNQILKSFSERKFSVLVATDVASRGLDIDDVKLVINYQLPEESVNYVHRIGRTARAGKDGMAVSISSSEDGYNQLKIEEYLGKKIPLAWIPEKELEQSIVLPQTIFSRKDSAMKQTNRSSSQSNRIQNRASFKRRSHSTSNLAHPRTSRERVKKSPSRVSSKAKRKYSSAANIRQQQRVPQRKMRSKKEESFLYPIIGNPMIYCTKTGEEKKSPVNQVQKPADSDDRVNLLHKISKRMNSIFTKK